MNYFASMTAQTVDFHDELVTMSLETDVTDAASEKDVYITVKEQLAHEMGTDYDDVNVMFFHCSKLP